MLRKLLLPPLVPTALLVVLCIYAVVSETTGAPRIIDGKPDNAPRNAGMILMILSPVYYLLFGMINLLDAFLDRRGIWPAWIWTGALCTVLWVMLFRMFYIPTLDDSPATALMGSFGVAWIILCPMSLLRRLLLNRPQRVE